MRKISLMIILIIITLIYSELCDKFGKTPSNETDCFGHLNDEEKNDLKKTHCCYFESEDQVDPKCMALTQMQYENINDFIKYNEILWGHVNIKINCNSFYSKVGIFIKFNILLFALFI